MLALLKVFLAPSQVDQAVNDAMRATPLLRVGGLVYRNICVKRTMTEQSLASWDEAEERQ
jgi:hypothetical protein